MAKFRRKNIRLPSVVYENPSQIFSITICTWRRYPLFATPLYAESLITTLQKGLFADNTNLFAYCLMPDHLHLLISPKFGLLTDFINRWKSYTANQFRKMGLSTKCWQRGFYDHALRKDEEIKNTAEYIVHNPKRAGLVEDWNEYPYAWHKWLSK